MNAHIASHFKPADADENIVGGAEAPRVDKEIEELLRKVVSESRPHQTYNAAPRWRAILEGIIVAGIIALAAREYQAGVWEAKVTGALQSIKVELGAIQSKVQAPFPSDPPGDPPGAQQR